MPRALPIETPAIHAELVAALFAAAVPLTIMTATFACVGMFIVIATGDTMAGAATLVGLIAAAGKASLHVSFRRRDRAPLNEGEAACWERRFAIGNLAFAAALGALVARTFTYPESGSQLLATGLLFGFCSGQVARIAVRARICSLSICMAAVPPALAAAAHGDAAHLGLAALFALFAAGSIETIQYAYGQTRDRIASNFNLADMANVDPLTGINNRFGLRKALDAAASAGMTHGSLICVHCFDLDGFKGVNDRHGHAIGDVLLVEVGRRLIQLMREDDIAARLGGDEFVVVQSNVTHPDEAEIFARRLCRAVSAPYRLDQRTIIIGMSIGSCTGGHDLDHFDDLLAVADRRMYAAKQSGGGVHSELAQF